MKHFIVTAALCILASSASAFDPKNMTDAERSAFRAEVRSYLLDNPEVLEEAIGVLRQRQVGASAARESEMISANKDALFNDGYSYVKGNPDGDVTIVEFMDYRCGYCKRAQPEVARLLAEDKNLRVIVKEFPILGEESIQAAEFALAVKETYGDETYVLVHDTMMNMRDINAKTLADLASQLDLDMGKLTPSMKSPEVQKVIALNHALGQALQITGTPTFVIEDSFVRGFAPADQMAVLIDSKRQ